MSFEMARAIADTVMYEGYVLYPYRASSAKNSRRARFQFGVVVPPAYAAEGHGEAAMQQTECLIEDGVVLTARLRFLHLESRTVQQRVDGNWVDVEQFEMDGELHVTWDVGIERTVDVVLRFDDLPHVHGFAFEGGRAVEPLGDSGRVVVERLPVEGRLVFGLTSLPRIRRLRVVVENQTVVEGAVRTRDGALRRSLLGAHTILGVEGGAFVSLLEPPADLVGAATACDNRHTWPVLVGKNGARDCMLSSPIILYDYPQIADESRTSFHDATEIDEMLTLRVVTLTDEEKREMARTDPRSRAILEQTDGIPAEYFERLHGVVRSVPPSSWDDLLADIPSFGGFDATIDAHRDAIEIDGVRVGRGSRVRLHPRGRADAHDMFLSERTARVEAVYTDVDERTHVAVTLEDDPAAELHAEVRRYLYFGKDEIAPLEAQESARKEPAQ